MRHFIIFYAIFVILLQKNALFAQSDFSTIPAVSYLVVDPLTGIPMDVSIDEFSLARAELTQREFQAVMGYDPSYHQGPDLPVESVSWWEAVRYCNLRSLKEGLSPCYDLATGECDYSRNGYRLPTDAEWSLADSSATPWTLETLHEYGNIGSANTESIPELEKDLKESGTLKAGKFQPNIFGLYDMLGNVWEWCSDYKDPGQGVPIPLKDPRGPGWGVERVLRGGSFISLANSWGKDYRSSMMPEYKSRFTGFRVCRASGREPAAVFAESNWFEPYNRIPHGFENNLGNLPSLLVNAKGARIADLSQWTNRRKEIKDKWLKILGIEEDTPQLPSVKLVRTFKEDIYTGKLMYLQVEPDYWEKIYLMLPDRPLTEPTPVVIVPYYDVDTPAGKNLGGRTLNPMSVRSFAYLMVQQGCIAVAVRWFGESYGENYAESVANLTLRHPGLTGLGKWVRDSHRLLDYLYSLPEVDRGNIGIIGHSLGGKMSLYAAAFEERITAVVSSELGIGLQDFSNYYDYWYFGDFIRRVDKATDHHELLGLIAPRPFLLIAGEEFDGDRSWPYINAAREVYSMFGKPLNIGCFNHRTGHTPSPEADRLATLWLKHFLNVK